MLYKIGCFFRCGCVASPEVPLQALASAPILDQKDAKLVTSSVERQPMAHRDGLEIRDDENNNAVLSTDEMDQPLRPRSETEEKDETTDDSGCLELFDELLLLELTGGRRRQSTPFNNNDIWQHRPSAGGGNNSLDCDNCDIDDDDDGYIEELKNYGKIFFDELLRPYAAVQLRSNTKTATALTETTKNKLRNSWRCSDEASCQLAAKTDTGQSWPQRTITPCNLRHCPAPDCDWNCEVGGLQDDLLLVWDCPECRLISEIVAAAGEKGCPSWTKDAAARQRQCSGDLGGQCRVNDVLYDETGHGQSPLRTDRAECFGDIRCHSRLEEDAVRISRIGDSGRPRPEQGHVSPQRLLPSNPASGRIPSLPPALDRTRTSSTPASGRSSSPANLQSLTRRIPNVTPALQRAGTPSILSPPPRRLPPPSGGASPALPPPSGGATPALPPPSGGAPHALPPPPPPAPPKYSGRPTSTSSLKPSSAEGSQQLLMSTAQLIGVDLVRHYFAIIIKFLSY